MTETSKGRASITFSATALLKGLCYALPLLIWLLPASVLGGGFSTTQHRMLAILAFAVVFWILEPIPVFATSVLLIFLQLVTVSDSALSLLRPTGVDLGRLVSHKEYFHAFASPVIMLFLGGFFLAGAATKYDLDRNLARVFLKPLGQNVPTVLLGFMGITCFFSFWMANTPVTAMMLAIVAPVVGLFDAKDPGRVAFLLGIPIASSLGGIATPVGTPINAIALKFLPGGQEVDFATWMLAAVPYVAVMLLLSWILLRYLFPSRLQKVSVEIKGDFDTSVKAKIVYVIFPATILLWLTSSWLGVNIYTVALFPVAVFLATGVMGKNDLKKMSWDVLWLISGGIALGTGLEATGLTDSLVALVPFKALSPVLLIIVSTVTALGIATMMSHTATANLLIPIIAAVGAKASGLETWGGSQFLILAVGATCSLGMALPISTPCNALAYASGAVTNRDMIKAGGIISILGVMILLVALFSIAHLQ